MLLLLLHRLHFALASESRAQCKRLAVRVTGVGYHTYKDHGDPSKFGTKGEHQPPKFILLLCCDVMCCAASHRAMLPRLPEGLMRLPHWAPTGPFSSRSGDTSSSQTQKQNQGVDMPALAPLRQQMGLLQGAAAAAGGGHGLHELKAPAHIQQVCFVSGC